MDTIVNISAYAFAQNICNGELSARETNEVHIQQIEGIHDKINALVIPFFEEDLKQAKEAVRKWDRGIDLAMDSFIEASCQSPHGFQPLEVRTKFTDLRQA